MNEEGVTRQNARERYATDDIEIDPIEPTCSISIFV